MDNSRINCLRNFTSWYVCHLSLPSPPSVSRVILWRHQNCSALSCFLLLREGDAPFNPPPLHTPLFQTGLLLVLQSWHSTPKAAHWSCATLPNLKLLPFQWVHWIVRRAVSALKVQKRCHGFYPLSYVTHKISWAGMNRLWHTEGKKPIMPPTCPVANIDRETFLLLHRDRTGKSLILLPHTHTHTETIKKKPLQ